MEEVEEVELEVEEVVEEVEVEVEVEDEVEEEVVVQVKFVSMKPNCGIIFNPVPSPSTVFLLPIEKCRKLLFYLKQVTIPHLQKTFLCHSSPTDCE